MHILIIDDHPLVTDGIAASLRTKGFEVTVSHTLEDCKQHLESGAYDLLSLDLDLGGCFGTDLLTENRVLPPCVILSGTTDRDEIAMALDYGAKAFIPKNIPFDHVVRAIEMATSLPNAAEEPFLWDDTTCAFAPLSSLFPKGTLLSPQERKVFQLMKEGLQDKQIAADLDRSIHTVRVQIRSILRKRGSKRRGEAL